MRRNFNEITLGIRELMIEPNTRPKLVPEELPGKTQRRQYRHANRSNPFSRGMDPDTTVPKEFHSLFRRLNIPGTLRIIGIA
jgi:hypothetical protein